MIKYFFKLEYAKFYGIDKIDNEKIEERQVIGLFSSKKLAEETLEFCLSYRDVEEKDFITSRVKVTLDKPIKILYLPFHEYSIKEPNGEYVDYYYVFQPKATKKEANELCNLLKNKKKYSKHACRDYSVYPPDGFGIENIEINKNYFKGI